jgi:20S proteasome alpha/beta subunit
MLFSAIIVEVVAASALKSSEGFTRPVPTAIVIVGYTGCTSYHWYGFDHYGCYYYQCFFKEWSALMPAVLYIFFA